MIRSLLIANRGEIARRIIRTCRRLGIRAVGVYSEADSTSLHVAEADAAVWLGPAPAADSYLNISAILEAARRTGVDAIHPGYGFLAENVAFARACAESGILFIGPPAGAIAAMGDKRAARGLAEQLGLAVIPGYDGDDQSDAAFTQAAERLGYPVMIKAAAGGGGKGMRLVHAPAELPEALAGARREALAAFGTGDLLLERALARPRHVEIQILADRHGRAIHLGERECSIQRRHQKVIEEAPSPALTEETRAAMGAAAVRLAEAVDYTGAGTVEFLLDGDRFYFLEMNTRLQVEHPVTELITGIDLVEWQIRVAEGERLPWRQEEVMIGGHAIEARVYAEDPANEFLPTTGPVHLWRPPASDGIRVDDGIHSGDQVTIHYDPMLAKIIARGETRHEAARRLVSGLKQTVLFGLTANLPHLIAILEHPAFLAGETSTRFLEEHPIDPHPTPNDEQVALIAAALARWQSDSAGGPGYWRNNPGEPAPHRFQLNGRDEPVWLRPHPNAAGRFTARVGSGEAREIALESYAPPVITLTIDGLRQRLTVLPAGDGWWVQTDYGAIRLAALPLLPEPHRPADAGGSLRAPMPGTVLAVMVEVGQAVEEGQPLVKLEAMKMEHTIRTVATGVVEAVYFAAGDQVGADDLLVRVVAVES